MADVIGTRLPETGCAMRAPVIRLTIGRRGSRRYGHMNGVSATSGYRPDAAPSYTVARQRKLRKTLVSYGVLTRGNLRELTGAEHWEVVFDLVLLRAVAAGRVRRLGDDLYEAGPTH